MNVEVRSRVFDQEAGSTLSSLRDGDLSTQRLFRCIPYELDLNPLRIVIAELVGTFILMFSVCGVISSTQLSGGHVGLLEYAATAGLSVVVVVYSIGHISGAHLNPSITIAFALFGGFPWSQLLSPGSVIYNGANAGGNGGNVSWGVSLRRGSMNPARSLGPAVVAWDFEYIWVYMTAPVIGAIMGVLTYRTISLKSRPSPHSPPVSSLLR
ncbi:hypothetical protein IGI04_020936 [Brassica rapa subsp. trilocularis]|uniref:Aquaporin n=1 Tax=Brassica rapa subsp. trilocularis TaxID=1813537 RepID=A0ABQ7MK60_BRACM|nr:hypothetical protein IGI04_020936 [Brassica rapa subsp. trilocularis]